MNYCKYPVLYTSQEISARIKELAHDISNEYRGKDLTIVCVMDGAIHFCADLIREITIPLKFSSIKSKSYIGTKSTGTVNSVVSDTYTGSHVLIVEDILDTGNTLSAITNRISKDSPLSIKTCCLLNNPKGRVIQFESDYTGFTTNGEFVIGYGLDLDGMFRNIPDIRIYQV